MSEVQTGARIVFVMACVVWAMRSVEGAELKDDMTLVDFGRWLLRGAFVIGVTNLVLRELAR